MTDRNIEVAKRLGYHIYHYDKDHPDQCYYQLRDPDGTAGGFYRENEHKTEAEAWQDVPEWDDDLNLALELLEYREDFAIVQRNKRWSVIPNEWVSLDELPGAIVEWFLAHVNVKALERERKAKQLKDKIAQLQDELAEVESEPIGGKADGI